MVVIISVLFFNELTTFFTLSEYFLATFIPLVASHAPIYNENISKRDFNNLYIIIIVHTLLRYNARKELDMDIQH